MEDRATRKAAKRAEQRQLREAMEAAAAARESESREAEQHQHAGAWEMESMRATLEATALEKLHGRAPEAVGEDMIHTETEKIQAHDAGKRVSEAISMQHDAKFERDLENELVQRSKHTRDLI